MHVHVHSVFAYAVEGESIHGKLLTNSSIWEKRQAWMVRH